MAAFQITDPESLTVMSFSSPFAGFLGFLQIGGDFTGQLLRIAIAPVFIGTLKRFYPSTLLSKIVNVCTPSLYYREHSALCELSASSPVNICSHGEF